MERAVNRPKHAHQALCTPKRVILLGLLFIVIAAAIAVPLGVVYGRRSRGATSGAGFTVSFAFVASGTVDDFADASKRRAILNVITSTAGLGQTAPAGSKLHVSAGSVNLEAAIPVASAATAASAVLTINSAISAPSDLTALLVAGGVEDVTVQSIAVAHKQESTDDEAMISPEDATLFAKLQLVNYDSCRTLARSLRLWPGSNSGGYVSLSSRYTSNRPLTHSLAYLLTYSGTCL